MPETVSVSLPGGTLPPQPRRFFVPRGLPERSFHQERIEQQLGDPAALEQVTFLVPNGWTGHDGAGICDPDDPGLAWRGRTEAAGDGWTVTFDRYAAMDTAAWNELRNSGGHRFTHAGRLARADGSAFTGDEAFDALDRVRMGLNLALGRRVTCALPVGWRDGRPVWCRWRSARVDGYRDASQWLDDTTSYRQVSEVVSRVLDFTATPVDKESLRYAVSYYVTANVDVDVELSASVPVSGLQLLAFLRFVTQRGTYSRSQWEQMDTEEQIRLLVEEIGIETPVPAHFSHLASAQGRLASSRRAAQGRPRRHREDAEHRDAPDPGPARHLLSLRVGGGRNARPLLAVPLPPEHRRVPGADRRDHAAAAALDRLDAAGSLAAGSRLAPFRRAWWRPPLRLMRGRPGRSDRVSRRACSSASVGCFSSSGVPWAQPSEDKRQVPAGRPGIPGPGPIRPTLVPSGSAMAGPATPARRPLLSSRSG